MSTANLIARMPMSDEQLQKLLDDDVVATQSLMGSLVQENLALRQEVEDLQVYRALAYRDPLTGLRNRRYMEERLGEEIDRSKRGTESPFSVLMVDVDEFKAINDTHGHGIGDETLVWVAQFLERNLRDHDICCRTGGDEFTILLPRADAEGCAQLVERLREQLDTANAGRTIAVSLSVGSATWPRDGATASRLLETADTAMYRDKQRRKARRLPADTVRMQAREATLSWPGPSTTLQ